MLRGPSSSCASRARTRGRAAEGAAAVELFSGSYNEWMPVRDVIIVGAGPSGLAAAIAARTHDLDYEVLEKGTLVNSIYHFPPHMVFFTTPELLEIGGLPFVSPNDKPTRGEALRYYRKVVDAYDLQIGF